MSGRSQATSSLSLSHAHIFLTRTNTYIRSHAPSFFLPLPFSCPHSLTLALSRSIPLALSFSLASSLSFSLSHTHEVAHLPHALSLSFSRSLSFSLSRSRPLSISLSIFPYFWCLLSRSLSLSAILFFSFFSFTLPCSVFFAPFFSVRCSRSHSRALSLADFAEIREYAFYRLQTYGHIQIHAWICICTHVFIHLYIYTTPAPTPPTHTAYIYKHTYA